MKRTGYVSNSSSSSFVLQKSKMTPEQIRAVSLCEAEPEFEGSGDAWTVDDDGEFLRGWTSMDNGYMDKLFKRIELNMGAIITWEGE